MRRVSIKRGRYLAFTLVELLVVLAIIAVLAGLIAGGGLTGQDVARERRARADLERISGMLLDHQQTNGSLPTDDGWTNVISGKVNGPPLIDPWETPYRYETNGVHSFSVYSLGPDRQEGGSFDDDNIVGGR